MVLRKIVGERWAFPLVEIVMLITVVAVGYLAYLQQQQTDCVRAYNESQARVNMIRAEAADRRAEALAELMRASLTSGADYRREAQEYLDAYDAEKRTRTENPLTPPPSDFCG